MNFRLRKKLNQIIIKFKFPLLFYLRKFIKNSCPFTLKDKRDNRNPAYQLVVKAEPHFLYNDKPSNATAVIYFTRASSLQCMSIYGCKRTRI